MPSPAPGGARPHRPRPLRIGWMALLLAAVLYLAGSNIGSGWIIVLTAALAGAVLLDLLAVWRTARATEVAVQPPAAATTTEPADLRVDLRRPDLGTTAHVADAAGDLRALVRTAEAHVRGPVPLDRGVHHEACAVVRTTGPLGLADAVAVHRVPAATWVRPGVLPAGARVRALVAAGGGDAPRAAPGHDDVRGVREHTSSDPRRAVHWRATARHGRLMVRDLEAAGGRPLRLALAEGTWTARSLHLATAAAASLAVAATAAGHVVEVAADGAVRGWDAAAWQALAALPPAAGLAARPLAPTPAAGGLRLACHRDGVQIGSGAAAVVLRDGGELAAWLRAQA